MAAIAVAARARPPKPVRFCWVGPAQVDSLPKEARRLGIEQVVEFVGEVVNLYLLL
jgi:hypothetical protein